MRRARGAKEKRVWWGEAADARPIESERGSFRAQGGACSTHEGLAHLRTDVANESLAAVMLNNG